MTTLRDAAADAGVHVGAAVDADSLRTDTDYRETLAREFDAVVAENAMKWGRLATGEGGYDFADADDIVEFAERHDMYVRGHTLVWHRMYPEWLRPWSRSEAEARRLLRTHVQTVAGRYRGRVDAWDVVNEAVADDGGLRETQWLEALGPDYVAEAFEWADAVSDADLFYNDYGADGRSEKADEVYELVSDFVARGVPIDGVGLQLHVFDEQVPPADVAANVDRLTDLGLKVHVTELDVGIGAAVDDRAEQADYYRDVVSAAVDAGADTVVTWGVDDGQSWLPVASGGGENPLLFDEQFRPKPARDAVVDALSR
ncbi:endo-1,4-beta-xylanase [Candidatus Halobonum tyrrellensis]|uniref:endo-1,4-beta-xylanase n=1 Tax=Candidatus Halobonum tyrrellensis G22 TaxID=1324957 RepID=V4HAM5_9EURY|nr:endo-1,4-beta-xylanase [Candidatus Halobonum tyrrellensis]ESP87108.1 endo-1,4-beta-xylanase [Candidatus Halobonum tyrrellensis G22]